MRKIWVGISVVLLSGVCLTQTANLDQNPADVRSKTSSLLDVELTRTLDAKKTVAGDSVLARTTEDARLSSGVVIPKNSKLIGRVRSAQAKGRGAPDSRLVFVFEKALLRDGKEIPLKVGIESISPAESSSNLAGSDAGVAIRSFEPENANRTASRATGLKGVELESNDLDAAKELVLRSSGDNIRVESGARLVLRVIEQ